MGVWVVNATSRALCPWDRDPLGIVLDGCGKSRPLPVFDRRTVQSIENRYTDYAIPTDNK